MVRIGFLGNVRFAIYALKPFISWPYTMDGRGRVTFSPTVRTILLFVNVTLAVFGLFFTVSVLRPKGVSGNGYRLLGFSRRVLHSVLIATVSVWNAHHSGRAAKIFFGLADLGNRLPFDTRQLLLMTAGNAIETLYVYLNTSFGVFITCNRYGFSLEFLVNLSFIYFEFVSTSSEITIINVIIIINVFGRMLEKEMDSVAGEREMAFNVILFRDLIGSDRKLTPQPSKSEKLKRIRDLYRKIYDIKEEAHEAFSYPLLVTTAMIFGNLVFYVFVNTMQLKYGTRLSRTDFVISYYYPFLLCVRLAVIVIVFSGFKEMIKKARLKVAKLYAKADSEKERDIICGLIQEMRYMDPDITCYKFAVIDYEMAGSMIGIIITYAIILLQTKFEEDGSDPVKNLLNFGARDQHTTMR
ncbi:UNVERIFIED_CONTAM: hypothetical protein PYX00_005902 [Menopon gallinae]|uniref:Gustatory receptor n=1 Tax=Menopon gallinae TaxID=328185 RepID=A0AAW2HV78_9NEOP